MPPSAGQTPYKKKLIEVALPLEAINRESAREKSIRHGHPSTLHLWWARRPLAAARAVIWASLVDDPSSLTDQFPTEEEQDAERDRLFGILEELVKWESSNDPDVLEAAKAEIMKSTNGNPPPLLDPFAGGGSIPLEAQRLGLKAHAFDLNPVAVMINKAMIELPPKFAGRPPINPEASEGPLSHDWHGAQGLAEDVRHYGQWMKERAFERIGHLYPKVKDEHGGELTVIAWLWTRTVKCPNPACACTAPLASSFELSKKSGREAYVQPVIEGKKVRFEVRQGKGAQSGTVKRNGATCIFCNSPIQFDHVRAEGRAGCLGEQMMAIVADGSGGRVFSPPNDKHIKMAHCAEPKDGVPQTLLPEKALGFRIQAYGMTKHKDLFTNRQLTALSTFSGLVIEARAKVIADGGSQECADAIAVYLSFAVGKIADRGSTIAGWDISAVKIRNTFGRQALSMTWDFAEANPFSDSSGCFSNALDWVAKNLEHLPATSPGYAKQADAQTDSGQRNVMVSTDPPYYDNIGYADLSDFFYVWLRQQLKDIYPDLFRTIVTPKAEELVAEPNRFEGGRNEARNFFEQGMLQTFKQIYSYATDDAPVTVYYAFKQSESGGDEDDVSGAQQTASTGWETMLTAIIKAGFTITGTWPMRTELSNRMRGMESNALASSIVLVCRRRPAAATACTLGEFSGALRRELRPALANLLKSSIAPVDLAQAAIGPGMLVYSRYSAILESSGAHLGLRRALQMINAELDNYFNEQDGELDGQTRFCIDMFSQYGFSPAEYGVAEVLEKAKNTNIKSMKDALEAKSGRVRLFKPNEIDCAANPNFIWLYAQQLARAIVDRGVEGVAALVRDVHSDAPEKALALAYRLYTMAERKGMAADAQPYNYLAISWPDVRARLIDMRAPTGQAQTLLET